MLPLIWWIYDGYAWLTNAIPTGSGASACCCSAGWAAS